MNDYTPTTEEVRDVYTASEGVGFIDQREAMFDRWLAAHDAEVAKRARKDAAEAVREALRHKRNENIVLPTHPPQSACICGRVWPHIVDPIAAARGNTEKRISTFGSHTEERTRGESAE